MRKTLKF